MYMSQLFFPLNHLNNHLNLILKVKLTRLLPFLIFIKSKVNIQKVISYTLEINHQDNLKLIILNFNHSLLNLIITIIIKLYLVNKLLTFNFEESSFLVKSSYNK